MNNLIIYGGTFDPVHFGHLNIAKKIQLAVNFERFLFLPCKDPVLKLTAHATSSQRVAMLSLALQEIRGAFNFEINLSEIERNSPSYTIETLLEFRKKLGTNYAITFLMGEDTFLELPKWENWQKLLNLCHILVVKRDIYPKELTLELKEFVSVKSTTIINNLKELPHGYIYQMNAGIHPASSSNIRKLLTRKHNYQKLKQYIPSIVLNYIKQHELYTKL